MLVNELDKANIFLIILRAEEAEGVNLVINGSLLSGFLIFFLSSRERSKNLTLFKLWLINLG